eukprot:gene18823-1225_t
MQVWTPQVQVMYPPEQQPIEVTNTFSCWEAVGTTAAGEAEPSAAVEVTKAAMLQSSPSAGLVDSASISDCDAPTGRAAVTHTAIRSRSSHVAVSKATHSISPSYLAMLG